jgi:hypothetical protein
MFQFLKILDKSDTKTFNKLISLSFKSVKELWLTIILSFS